jgi:hypothetical protein
MAKHHVRVIELSPSGTVVSEPPPNRRARNPYVELF